MSRCKKCGFENKEGSKFCGHCGAPLQTRSSGKGIFIGVICIVLVVVGIIVATLFLAGRSKQRDTKQTEKMTEEMGTKTPSNEQRIGNLSGGNQQKALLGKWMFTEPDILILDEPTRGIDVGAKYDIYCLINQMVEEGKSVIMISSEMPEILGMCDRIYIMNEGKMAGELDAKEATQEGIMAHIMQNQKK